MGSARAPRQAPRGAQVSPRAKKGQPPRAGQVAQRGPSSASAGSPANQPIRAVTLFAGTKRSVAVALMPASLVAFAAASSCGWQASGRSPYPGLKRRLVEKPRARALGDERVERGDGGLDERRARRVEHGALEGPLAAEGAQHPLVLEAERAGEHRHVAGAPQVPEDVDPLEHDRGPLEGEPRRAALGHPGGAEREERPGAARGAAALELLDDGIDTPCELRFELLPAVAEVAQHLGTVDRDGAGLGPPGMRDARLRRRRRRRPVRHRYRPSASVAARATSTRFMV